MRGIPRMQFTGGGFDGGGRGRGGGGEGCSPDTDVNTELNPLEKV